MYPKDENELVIKVRGLAPEDLRLYAIVQTNSSCGTVEKLGALLKLLSRHSGWPVDDLANRMGTEWYLKALKSLFEQMAPLINQYNADVLANANGLQAIANVRVPGEES